MAISTITTTARQPTRIKIDLDSVGSLAPESELGLTGSKNKNVSVMLYIRFIFYIILSIRKLDQTMNLLGITVR